MPKKMDRKKQRLDSDVDMLSTKAIMNTPDAHKVGSFVLDFVFTFWPYLEMETNISAYFFP